MLFDNQGFLNVTELEGIPVRIDKVPTHTKEYKSTRRTDKQYIVIHNAGNSKADDVANNNYMKNDDYILWHFTVDEDSVTQGHSILKSAYHAGDGRDGKGNLYGIGIEIADDGNVAKACRNAFALVKALQNKSPFDALEIQPHQFFSGKYCPRWVLDNWGWQGFIHKYEAYLKTSSVPEWKMAIIKKSFEIGAITELERWTEDIDKNMPVWATLAVVNNIYTKLERRINRLEKERGEQ